MAGDTSAIARRLVDRDGAAEYLGSVSVDTVDRLINLGELPIVRLPMQRSRHDGKGAPGTNRRILIDVKDLDALIERSKERKQDRPGFVDQGGTSAAGRPHQWMTRSG